MGLRGRQGIFAALPIVVAFVCGSECGALAQAENYLSTSGVPTATQSAGAAGGSSIPYSGLYARAQAQTLPNAPPWTLSGHLGIDEIATDNVNYSPNDRIADLISLFTAGATATADTPRLNGIFSATGLYGKYIEYTRGDHFDAYGLARGQATILPDTLYFYIRGLADDFSRVGGGIQNSLVGAPEETHIYEVSGTPFLYNDIDDFAVNVLRYQIGQVWFAHNTNEQDIFGVPVAPISDSTDQLAREDLKIPGTLLPRLLTDVSLSAQENDSGPLGSGDFTRYRGELINEYEITRAVSAIGGVGYERLHDNEFANVDGDGPVWDIGARFRPNPDSYALLTYGHHDLASDFAGELVWRVTARTDVYAAYTDAITNGQQGLIFANDASELGPEGTMTHVAFDESTVIGTLDDQLLSAPPGAGGAVSLLGVPLADIYNALPVENGLFRITALRAAAYTIFEDNPIRLTILRLERTRLTDSGASGGPVGNVETSEGAILSWSPSLGYRLNGLAGIHYEHVDLGTNTVLPFAVPGRSDNFGATFGLTWGISRSLTALARYDFVYRVANQSSQNAYRNAVTIGLRKTFQ